MGDPQVIPPWKPGMSAAEYVASLPADLRDDVLQRYSRSQQAALKYDWRFWGRPDQMTPIGRWFCWMIQAGRGWGKTRAGAEFIRERVRNGQAKRIALVAKTPADARDTMIEDFEDGPGSGLLAIGPPRDHPLYEPSKRRLVWPRYGATATIYSGAEPDQLRGPGHDTAWVDELPAFRFPKSTWDNLMLGLRLGADPRVVVTTTPRPIPLLRSILSQPSTVVTHGTTYDNRSNLPEGFYQHVVSQYRGTRLEAQEIEGRLLKSVEGALWNYDTLEDCRVNVMPDFSMVAIGVDPQQKAREGLASETGIVAAGVAMLGGLRHGYIIEDGSTSARPGGWAARVVELYHRLKANYVVAEINNGGDMVAHTIHTADPAVPVVVVNASRGKYTRAEPISALYHQGRVHHIGSFPKLEDQQCTWVPGEPSPDRMDAMVWVLTALMVGKITGRGFTWGRQTG